MPLYEYQCTACGQRIEVLQRFQDAPLHECPHCGGALTKLLSAPALQFKGSGFYLTDYGRAGGRRDDSGEKAEAAKDAGKSAESKPDGAAKPAAETKATPSSEKKAS
jgi:putative FmdB family regulatory protein